MKISSLSLTEDSDDIFDLSGPQLKYLLSTRTAIGVTDNLFVENFVPDFRVFYQLKLKDSASGANGELDVGYPSPHEYLSKTKELQEVNAAF